MAKLGIISFAHVHAGGYAACIQNTPAADLAAIWDDDAARGRQAAEQFGCDFMNDLDDFLSSDVEGVVITAENVRHRELVEKAAAAGKWILCEKPLATTVEDAQAIIAACEKAGVGLGTAFPCRYSTPLRNVRDQVAAGGLGRIYAAACTNNGQFPGGWFGDAALAGGGAAMDHTVHVVDLLRWMLEGEFTSVYCENGHLHGRDTELDDVGVVQMEMDAGGPEPVIVSHIASWNRPKSFPTWGDVTIEFIGEKGTLYVDAFRQKIDVYDDTANRLFWAGWGGNMDMGLVAEFAQAVDQRRAPAITGEDGLRATEVTTAAYQSARTGEVVAIG